MVANGTLPNELFTNGDPCVACGKPVLEITRGVIDRRMLYHGRCWLTSAPVDDGIIATQQPRTSETPLIPSGP